MQMICQSYKSISQIVLFKIDTLFTGNKEVVGSGPIFSPLQKHLSATASFFCLQKMRLEINNTICFLDLHTPSYLSDKEKICLKKKKSKAMASLKSKYKRQEQELIHSLVKSGTRTFITRIELIETSKIKDHKIYECSYVDNGNKKQVNIISVDVADALNKLDAMLGFGLPQQAANFMLSNQKLNHK